jgi:hypothetical protein
MRRNGGMSVSDMPESVAKTVMVTNNRIIRRQYGRTYLNSRVYVFMFDGDE